MVLMRNPIRFLLIGMVTLCAVNAIGALASEQWDFNYGWISLISLAVYIGFATFLSKHTSLLKVIGFTSLLGLFDATIGWKLSELLGANAEISPSTASTTVWLTTAVIMTALAGFLGLIGWLLFKMFSRKKEA